MNAFVLAVLLAQAPTGTISGTVTDMSGAVVPDARLMLSNDDTAQQRTLTSSGAGAYAGTMLAPGRYRLSVAHDGFKRLERQLTIEAGTTTTVDVVLEVGNANESVTVSAALPLLHRDDYTVSGVVTRRQIDTLPLNGRNFLDLAKLEPGVTAPARGTNNRLFVPILGSGLQTSPRVGAPRITVDGGNVALIGAPGAALQVSQDVVQEFQLSSTNFTQATSLTTSGAVNIVTRSGGNEVHASTVVLYRDQHLAAYPGLLRDASNPDPSFRRTQSGSALGGPIARDRAFFFASYERTSQDGVVSVQPGPPAFAGLGGIFPTSYRANQASARVDAQMRPGVTLFVRDSFDGNRGFAPLNAASNILPSGWSRTTNTVNQMLTSLTAVVTPHAVNDLRVSHFFVDSPEQPADGDDCPGCVGLGGPRILVPDANLVLGKARSLTFTGQRVEATDRFAWEHASHRVSLGADWEHATNSSSIATLDPAQLTLWSPERTRQILPALPLLAAYASVADILTLPLQNYQTAVGPTTVPQRAFSDERVFDLFRLFASDIWRPRNGLTIDTGLSWASEPNALNHDLDKPVLLTPILGANGLHPPRPARHWSPTIGVV